MTMARWPRFLLASLVLACHSGDAARPHWPVEGSSLESSAHAWPSDSTAPPQCRGAIVAIDADSFGPLRVGQTLRSILTECPKPVVGWEWGDDAEPSPALMTRFGSGLILVTLTDTTDTATAYYLSTRDPAFHTLDGVHVGMTVDSLQARLGTLEFVEGECGLYARSAKQPYLGIQLSLPADSLDCGYLVPTPPALPRGSVVVKLFLHSAT